ncbi:MAG: hypothetical protein ACOYO0_06430 [Sandarakinorhabdus sp.]|jgi:hypothetical protein
MRVHQRGSHSARRSLVADLHHDIPERAVGWIGPRQPGVGEQALGYRDAIHGQPVGRKEAQQRGRIGAAGFQERPFLPGNSGRWCRDCRCGQAERHGRQQPAPGNHAISTSSMPSLT